METSLGPTLAEFMYGPESVYFENLCTDFGPVHIFRERGPKTSFHTEIPDFQVNVYV